MEITRPPPARCHTCSRLSPSRPHSSSPPWDSASASRAVGDEPITTRSCRVEQTTDSRPKFTQENTYETLYTLVCAGHAELRTRGDRDPDRRGIIGSRHHRAGGYRNIL